MGVTFHASLVITNVIVGSDVGTSTCCRFLNECAEILWILIDKIKMRLKMSRFIVVVLFVLFYLNRDGDDEDTMLRPFHTLLISQYH